MRKEFWQRDTKNGGVGQRGAERWDAMAILVTGYFRLVFCAHQKTHLSLGQS